MKSQQRNPELVDLEGATTELAIGVLVLEARLDELLAAAGLEAAQPQT